LTSTLTSQSDGNGNPARRLWEASELSLFRKHTVMIALETEFESDAEREHVERLLNWLPLETEARVAMALYRKRHAVPTDEEKKRIHKNAIKLRSKHKMRALRAAEAAAAV
jgi:hypothetical protein